MPANKPSKCTMTLNLSADEMAALNKMAGRFDLSKTAVMKQALRLYQLVNHRLAAGETFHFSGDKERAALFLGIGFEQPDKRGNE